MVKCKNCGFKFPSFTQINEVAFKTIVLTNNPEECPDCSEVLAYNKRDYFFDRQNDRGVKYWSTNDYQDEDPNSNSSINEI